MSKKSSKKAARNVVTYNDTIFRAKAGRVFILTLFTMLIIGLVAGVVFSFRDSFLPLIPGAQTAVEKIEALFSQVPIVSEIVDTIEEFIADIIKVNDLARIALNCIIGMLVGFVLGIVLFIVIIIGKRGGERRSKKKFAKVTDKLISVRGGLVCESKVKAKRCGAADRVGGKGRLYLSATAIEFYSNKFAQDSSRNFAIHTANILKVETRGIKGKKIYVHSVDGTVQKFIVPVGRAKGWAHQILIAKNNAQYLVGGSSSED